MSTSFSYLSPRNNFAVDVYRHTLFTSINGPLGNVDIPMSVDAFRTACKLLNSQYAYWGHIVSFNSEFAMSADVVSLLLSNKFENETAKRKCCGVVILPTAVNAELIYETASIYLPAVPTMTFHTIPAAMSWVDEFMNHYASSELIR